METFTKQWPGQTQVSTNLWQARTHNSTTVNHWTFLPDKETWKTGIMREHFPHHHPPLLTNPEEISSPLPHHGTAHCAKSAAPHREVLTPCSLNNPKSVKTCTDSAHQVGGIIEKQLLQGLWTLQVTLPCCLQAAPDNVSWNILRSLSWILPQRVTSH